jgi:hypothetical protein
VWSFMESVNARRLFPIRPPECACAATPTQNTLHRKPRRAAHQRASDRVCVLTGRRSGNLATIVTGVARS